jgi:hypothetical protein
MSADLAMSEDRRRRIYSGGGFSQEFIIAN